MSWTVLLFPDSVRSQQPDRCPCGRNSLPWRERSACSLCPKGPRRLREDLEPLRRCADHHAALDKPVVDSDRGIDLALQAAELLATPPGSPTARGRWRGQSSGPCPGSCAASGRTCNPGTGSVSIRDRPSHGARPARSLPSDLEGAEPALVVPRSTRMPRSTCGASQSPPVLARRLPDQRAVDGVDAAADFMPRAGAGVDEQVRLPFVVPDARRGLALVQGLDPAVDRRLFPQDLAGRGIVGASAAVTHSTRSRGGKERRCCAMGEMSFDGGGEVLEDVTFLQTTGFDCREHPLHESTASGALGSE